MALTISGNVFSKVFDILTLCSKYTRALTCENVWQGCNSSRWSPRLVRPWSLWSQGKDVGVGEEEEEVVVGAVVKKQVY